MSSDTACWDRGFAKTRRRPRWLAALDQAHNARPGPGPSGEKPSCPSVVAVEHFRGASFAIAKSARRGRRRLGERCNVLPGGRSSGAAALRQAVGATASKGRQPIDHPAPPQPLRSSMLIEALAPSKVGSNGTAGGISPVEFPIARPLTIL
jgi:hypothetical protein